MNDVSRMIEYLKHNGGEASLVQLQMRDPPFENTHRTMRHLVETGDARWSEENNVSPTIYLDNDDSPNSMAETMAAVRPLIHPDALPSFDARLANIRRRQL